jgi:hypothetical protein
VVQPSRRPELYFQYGAPYAALQLDFRRNGKQNRLYAEWEEPAPEKLPLPPDDAALICEMPPNADPAGISRPDTVLAKSGLTASRHIRKRKNAGRIPFIRIDNRNGRVTRLCWQFWILNGFASRFSSAAFAADGSMAEMRNWFNARKSVRAFRKVDCTAQRRTGW